MSSLNFLSTSFGSKMTRLPDSQRVLIDVIEWYAHSAFLESSTDVDIQFAMEQLDCMCKVAFDQKPPLVRAGRVWNRILLTLLVHNICARKMFGSDPDALINMKPSDWEEMVLNLQECRSSLIKSNASSYPPEGFDKEDADMAELPMFNEVYTDVYDLLRCHLAIAQFRTSMEDSKPEHFHSHLDKFTNSLPKAFAQSGALVNFVRMDVLSSPKRSTNLCVKTRAHLKKLMQTVGKPYSYDTLQGRIKMLARTWNESILGIPTLVKLGYGGVPQEATGGDDTKTVSSWGMDEQQEFPSRRGMTTEEEEYHTADEMDEDDDTDDDSSTVVLPEVKSLEIRPRQSWKESFEMIEGLEEMRAEDNTNNKKNSKSKRDFPTQVSDVDCYEGAPSETNHSPQKRFLKRRNAGREKVQRLLGAISEDGMDTAVTTGLSVSANVRNSKATSSEDVSEPSRWQDDSSDDASLPTFLKLFGNVPRTTYAEYHARKSHASVQVEKTKVTHSKKKRRIFFHEIEHADS